MTDSSSSDSRLDALLASARAHPPSTGQAEYAFETRLLARLRMKPPTPVTWAEVSWRLVPFLGVFVLVLFMINARVVETAQTTEQMAYAQSPEAVELWNSFE